MISFKQLAVVAVIVSSAEAAIKGQAESSSIIGTGVTGVTKILCGTDQEFSVSVSGTRDAGQFEQEFKVLDKDAGTVADPHDVLTTGSVSSDFVPARTKITIGCTPLLPDGKGCTIKKSDSNGNTAGEKKVAVFVEVTNFPGARSAEIEVECVEPLVTEGPTPAPSESPNMTPTKVFGDPHFSTWSSEMYGK